MAISEDITIDRRLKVNSGKNGVQGDEFMEKDDEKMPHHTSLRQKAEEQLKLKYQSGKNALNEVDTLKLLYELEVHKLELQMQNDEMRVARDRAEKAAAMYSNLYEAIYDFSPAGYFSLSNDGTIEELNLNGAKMLGKDRSVLVKSNFRLLLTPATLPDFNLFLNRIFETGYKQTCEVQLFANGNASSYLYLEGVIPYAGIHCLITAIDSTARKRAELELKKSEIQLRELNATKDKFFSIIAHDLKSPFNTINGVSQFLLREYSGLTENEIKEFIAQIQESAYNSLCLVDNLLQWAESQTGIIGVSSERIDITAVLSETVLLMKPAADIKNIQINTSGQSGCMAKADSYMVRTIMRNLLGNAIKFTFEGGIIDLSASKVNNEILVSVADNGIGISSIDLEKLFKVDQKVILRGTANEKGSGLGLVLCKEFVEKQGGKIWAYSEPGKGFEIHFTLPSYL
jgi:signal transduction histidine kinase